MDDDTGEVKRVKPLYVLRVCDEQFPDAQVAIDKFHVMQYIYDAVLDLRTKIKKELTDMLSKGKDKTKEDKEILSKIDILKHC